MLLLLAAVLVVSPWNASAQFPAVCNTPDSLQTKTCCPNNCGGPTRGSCENITGQVVAQWNLADSEVTDLLEDAPNNPQKGTADARYLWPTVVFERVCVCNGNYWGVNCNECDFGWTGNNCTTRKTPVVRKSFSRLTPAEKQTLIDATRALKNEMGQWSVVVEEPTNYTSGRVTLQDVSTYDFFVYLHDYVARGDNTVCSTTANNNVTIDFAHSGPVFPVWHRRYILTVEREFQRITGNTSFGLPYWQWEENDLSLFAADYYGTPSNSFGPAVNVSGTLFDQGDWHTVCDITYWNIRSCSDYWRTCNPAEDLALRRPLQRGGGSSYLPNRIEVMIAIAAPSYDAANAEGKFLENDPRQSFRSRLEGWNIICSAVNCTGPQDPKEHHMHNVVHIWVGGQMDDVPAAVNDPIFNMHHCNVDRIFESWIQRFAAGNSDPNLLPTYVPARGGHPGHNRDDYIVPFFPLIKAGDQYRVAENWGYTYDELIAAGIPDHDIPNCNVTKSNYSCPICEANAQCLNCTTETCPGPIIQPLSVGPTDSPPDPLLPLGLGLGLGLGIPLLIAIAAVIALVIYILCHNKSQSPNSEREVIEMQAVKT